MIMPDLKPFGNLFVISPNVFPDPLVNRFQRFEAVSFLGSMETRGTSTSAASASDCAAVERDQKTPPPVASINGSRFFSVAVTLLISIGSSMPACATAARSRGPRHKLAAYDLWIAKF